MEEITGVNLLENQENDIKNNLELVDTITKNNLELVDKIIKNKIKANDKKYFINNNINIIQKNSNINNLKTNKKKISNMKVTII